MIDEQKILQALQRLPFEPPRILLIHSSLSSCGYIKGGGITIIRALRSWNARGTLAMPTHTYFYPKADGECRAFDPHTARSVVGTVTDTFWRLPGVVRSLHPTHSLACEGADAKRLISGHERCDTPCGQGSPYEQLIFEDAAVLMFGATMNSYTLFHTAEDAAAVPYLYYPDPVILKVHEPDGNVCDFPMRRQNMRVSRRFAEIDGWLEQQCLMYRTNCGHGELLLIPHAKAAHDAIIEELRSDPYFLLTSEFRDSSNNPGLSPF